MTTRFLISCAARTGSTMLEFMLRSHPDILMHGEVFNPNKIGPLDGRWNAIQGDPHFQAELWDWRTNNLPGFMRDVVWDPQGRPVVGFKFKTHEAFDHRWADVREIVAADKDIAIIHLYRRDLLAQYVSHEAVLHYGGPPMLYEGEAQIEPFTIDVDKAVAYAEDVLRLDTLARELYAGHPSTEVSYEALDTDAICRFLGVEPRPLKSRTQKLIADPRIVATNYDAAYEALLRRYEDRMGA